MNLKKTTKRTIVDGVVASTEVKQYGFVDGSWALKKRTVSADTDAIQFHHEETR
jgi:hypothetical protein